MSCSKSHAKKRGRCFNELSAKAAQSMRIPKSSISAAIDAFEADFGISLFLRQPSKGLDLTAGGRRAMDDLRHLLQQARQMEEDLSGQKDQLTGEFTIGCFAPLAPLILPFVVKAISEKHPGLTIRVIESDLGSVTELVLRGTSDMVLTYDLGQPEGTEFTPFCPAHAYALLPEDSAFAARSSVSLSELAPLPMILLDLPESRTYFEMLFRVAGLTPNVVFRAGTFQTLRSFVSYGLGYSLLNLRPATDFAYTGRKTKSVPLSDTVPAPIFGAMRREDTFLSPVAKDFTQICHDFCHSALGKRHFVPPCS